MTSDELLIMWQAPDKGGVDNYTLTLVAAHGAEVPMVHVVNGLTFSFTGAHPGETYNVSIVANKGTESSLVVVDQKTTSEYEGVFEKKVKFCTLDLVTCLHLKKSKKKHFFTALLGSHDNVEKRKERRFLSMRASLRKK